jgi:hypothetical protein
VSFASVSVGTDAADNARQIVDSAERTDVKSQR